jgi:hypothetical protein
MASQEPTAGELSERVTARIRELFAPSDRDAVVALLQQYRMDRRSKGTERIHLDSSEFATRALSESGNWSSWQTPTIAI